MASQKTIEIVKSTAPILKERGAEITKVFYHNLFLKHPQLKDVFNMTNQKKGTQAQSLATAVFQYASHIDQLDLLKQRVGEIAHKHASLSIQKEHYPIVGENLLAAIKEVLGVPQEVLDAWAEAYQDLASILIQTEENLYVKRETQENGFRGVKKFKVVKKEKESTEITSFYLSPSDGTSVPKFDAGQYIAIHLEIPESPHVVTRNYSLSDCSCEKYWRISVKRESLSPEGIASNYLQDTIQVEDEVTVGMPSGVFTLSTSKAPVLLLAGGVGITPLISMLKQARKEKRKVSLLHFCRSKEVQGFKKELEEWSDENCEILNYYSEVNGQLNENGRVSSHSIQSFLGNHETEIYYCGPEAFMNKVKEIFEEIDYPKQLLNFEFFGPAG